jgi:hypothetical protein
VKTVQCQTARTYEDCGRLYSSLKLRFKPLKLSRDPTMAQSDRQYLFITRTEGW